MDGIFVRGLWGDSLIPRWPKARQDAWLARWHDFPIEGPVVAFGDENADWLRKCGWKEVLQIGSRGLMGEGERGTDIHAPYGQSIWAHKLVAVLMAFHYYNPLWVVWLDWDCRLFRPLERIEQVIPSQPSFASALTRYKSNRCPWRESDKTLVPSGSWFYCADVDVVSAALTTMRQTGYYDEPTFACVTDALLRRMDREFSVQAYVDCGFQPRCVQTHRAVFPVPDEEAIFYAPLRQRRREIKQWTDKARKAGAKVPA